jgi:hypothetical protein
MSLALDKNIAKTGTRFRLFAQPRHLPAFSKPETVVISLPPNQVKPGPEDNRMFVADAIDKRPYGFVGGGSPQWKGPRHAAVQPAADGHFDKIDVDSREFSCATMYATVRRVLDIWEDYFGHRIEWFFSFAFDRLELIPSVEWDNAQSGDGFLEFGFGRTPFGGIDHSSPFCQNFDVLAHELGHNILFSEVGFPSSAGSDTEEFGGFHESGGDLTALVACLHFNSVVDHMLKNSRGNLFTVNELDRMGELPGGREIRVAFNNERMSTVSSEPHHLSLPLTGAIFDIFDDVFQKKLVANGLISADLARRSTHGLAPNSDLPKIQTEFDQAYAGHEAGFKETLLEARDYLGRILAKTWGRLNPNNLTYDGVGRALLAADLTEGGEHQKNIRECFAWREITIPNPSFLTRRVLSLKHDKATGHQLPDIASPEAVAAASKVEVAFEGSVIAVHVLVDGKEIPLNGSGDKHSGKKSLVLSGSKVPLSLEFAAPVSTRWSLAVTIDSKKVFSDEGLSNDDPFRIKRSITLA